ncbi:helix-turn-helix transcriptional regulator [Odoribacter sp. Z80]|uniref:helix-turn-helix domain-containing protein n=1 Tax=Odoribacter sp. Z80 TaxID=2304575 RepID=UPI00137A8E8B|nr:helix-turn-helix transcriptional regulator [Odoribacter sp. Z80]NCE71491.1 XRE family transcriptional regulator [Odoribacter sp. Z80]
MQERFKQLLEEKGLTATRFASMIKVNASAMSHILNGRSKPGFDVLDKIAQAFPELNLNWLISGKGTMYGVPVSPVQEVLFQPDDEKKGDKEHKEEKSVVPDLKTTVEEVEMPVQQAGKRKNIKRIVLFFEDGSFEDYEK